jgi:ferric-chelate reductase
LDAKLYDMAQAGRSKAMVQSIKVVVEGPYGGPGHTIYSSFSAAVLIAGGSGITYSLSVLEDLVLKDLNDESRVKSIDLVWSIPDPASLVPLLPTLSSLVRKSVCTPVRISVFYTAAPTGKQPSIITQALLSNMNPSRSPTPNGGRRILRLQRLTVCLLVLR